MQRLTTEVRAVLAAAVFFSRLPVPRRPLLDAADLRRAACYWPLIGLVVGAAMGTCWAAARPWLAAPVAAGLAVAVGVLLTGALQEDGFADVCDGFGGGATRERVLAIMQDSCVGSYGMAGLVVMVGLRWQAMAALPGAILPATVLAAQAASRAWAVALMAVLPYARGEGSRARPVVGRKSAPRLALAAATGLAPFLLGVPLPALGAAALVWLGCVLWFGGRIGGYTGDCVGATQQVTELAILLAVLATA
ncbi:Adenosylcobinamide-GDP ribazoletransferase [Rhodovastum atsumiense]|uniref:Adenosylcobinamide-GDP ribazoletransferase n=1 Tax=Rhodovastum atsumiense TaxID=504468 RepID=A0A5M6ISH6_9PROT|nr:adenosylcobinamide-GDP ribazoletransferase [Rhodovastum atsumiense]KAA5611264.1 adenosylcobinamide-GDP ribazoletransferase [Rhodovastum atsumiense]CAH2604001.1 Adenosylcobinamide-GDP ribazoletransferase [Rhodovastum atsumiense]